MILQKILQIVLAEYPYLRVDHDPHHRRARLFQQQGHLAKKVARPQIGQDLFVERRSSDHLNLSRLDKVQGVALFALGENCLAFQVSLVPKPFRNRP